jgi:hypothetical protein
MIATGSNRDPQTRGAPMFFFFSNRLGCGGSILISAAVTLILLWVMGIV